MGLSAGTPVLYFPIPPGETRTLAIELKDAREVKAVVFWMRLQVKRPSEPTTFYVDNFRLHPKTLDDAETLEVVLGPPALGGKLLASVPAQRLPIEVRVNVSPKESGGLRVRGRLGDAEQVQDVKGGRVVLDLPPPAADAPLLVELLDRQGKVLRTERQAIRRAPRAADEVGFDERGRCLVNGKPFFPVGIYNAQLDDFELLQRMGFNCVGPYFEAAGEYVTEAKRLGLRILSNVKGNDIAGSVAAMKDCGVLLGYYLFDEPEPGKMSRAQLTALCKQAADADPYHAVTGCNNEHFADYAGVSDVMMVDAYPMPKSFDKLIQRMTESTRAMRGRGPVWLIPQCFGWGAYCQGD
jgi:hypothetical protein